MKRMWEIKQQANEKNKLELYIYGDVKSDSYDWWNDEVIKSETSANRFRDELAKYAGASEINVYINSNGGSVFEGTAIYNQLKRHSAKKIVHIDGFACSIASVIAMAGDEVIMPKNALMMIHNMWMSACGNAVELRKAADDLDVINTAGRQAYISKAGDKLSEKELTKMMDAETWLTAEQCITYGLADKYDEKDADMSGATNVLQKANLSLSQRLDMQKSLAAQLRNLTAEPEPKPAPKPERGIMQTLAGTKK